MGSIIKKIASAKKIGLAKTRKKHSAKVLSMDEYVKFVEDYLNSDDFDREAYLKNKKLMNRGYVPIVIKD